MEITHLQADIRIPREPSDAARRSPGSRSIRWDLVRVGWLPGEGWFCSCGVRACGHVEAVREVAR